MIANLRRRELFRIASQLSEENQLAFRETQNGEHVEGYLKQRVDLVSGKFAMVENSLEFTLVPWRPRWISILANRNLGSCGVAGSVGPLAAVEQGPRYEDLCYLNIASGCRFCPWPFHSRCLYDRYFYWNEKTYALSKLADLIEHITVSEVAKVNPTPLRFSQHDKQEDLQSTG